jgi:hypothetical protein
MSWQSRVLGLVKNYGAPAKFAASVILNAVIPGSPAVIALIEQAFNTAEKTAQDDWEVGLSKQVQTTAENQARLEQMLDILGGKLQYLFAQIASFEKMPEIAEKLVAESRKSDPRFQAAASELDGIAHRFDHLEELSAKILASQRETHGKLDDISAAIKKIAESPTAAVLARARQLTVTEVIMDVRRCAVGVSQKTLLIDTDVSVKGEKRAPIPYRNVFFFLNGEPLASRATDEAGIACLRDPVPLNDFELQGSGLLQVRVDDTSKSASQNLSILTPPEIAVENFDPQEEIGSDVSSSGNRVTVE